MYDGKTADRAGTEYQEGDTGNQRGQVGVDDGCPCVLETEVDCLLRRHAFAQLFADTFVNQYVGVNRHTQRQRQCGNTGQRQRRLHGRQNTD